MEQARVASSPDSSLASMTIDKCVSAGEKYYFPTSQFHLSHSPEFYAMRKLGEL
jgi:hypothetical protein